MKKPQVLFTSRYGYELSYAKNGDVGVDLPCVIAPQSFEKTEQDIPRISVGGITDQTDLINKGLLNIKDSYINLPPGEFAVLPSGINVSMPTGTWMLITARSSTVFHLGVLVFPGIIDESYTGELLTKVYNLSNKIHSIRNGDKLSQAIFIHSNRCEFKQAEVGNLPHTSRGQSGFGSTGR